MRMFTPFLVKWVIIPELTWIFKPKDRRYSDACQWTPMETGKPITTHNSL